eukprot:scaffold113397_cov62-Attheya_sp.AAC.2
MALDGVTEIMIWQGLANKEGGEEEHHGGSATLGEERFCLSDSDDEEQEFSFRPNEAPRNGATGYVPAWAQEGSRRVRADQAVRKMRVITGMAAIGGFLFGYDTGVISGAMLPLRHAFDLSETQEEVVVTSTVFAAFCASLVGGSINAAFGRRVAIMVASTIFTIGSLLLGTAWSYESLVLGRIIVGIGIGLASLTTPIYIAELAQPQMRGTLVTVNALLVCVGQFTAGMVDGFFAQWEHVGWRYMLGLGALPSAIMLVGFLYLPESPRWLVMAGKSGQALDVLRSIRETDQEAHEEMLDIMAASPPPSATFTLQDYDAVNTSNEDPASPSVTNGYTSAFGKTHFVGRVGSILGHAPTRRALCIGCGMMALQQLSGINTVMYYAASIYEVSGFSGKSTFSTKLLLTKAVLTFL